MEVDRARTHVLDATMFWSRTGGGVRRYLRVKHAWIARQPGWRHTIAAPVVDAPDMALLPSWPLPGSGGYRMPVHRKRLAQCLQALQPDVIEAGDPYRLAWAALDAARTLQVPAVAFCHSNLERLAHGIGGPLAARVARRYSRHLYSQFDLVLAPSEAMRDHLLDWGVGQVACQPLGVDTRVFHPGRASVMWRNSLQLPAGTRLLIYAGRFGPEKHLDVLAKAVRRLGPPYLLLALGAGPAPPRGERVIAMPFVGDAIKLATMLASADAFVHAGDQETFGLSVLEALACGTPVVARAAEGLAELVDRRVGVPVHDGRADSFAQAISALFEAPRNERSSAARRRARAYDWDGLLPSLLGQYQHLLQHNVAVAPPLRSVVAPAGRNR
ncbi:MAG TPA: glycosyltransferase [Albitalea sp.]|nr:glycosyltransferase [Albitalea sp.]